MSGQQPTLPYAGTSGWSGTETSRERAERDDRDGTTAKRQTQVVIDLHAAGPRGMTWKEYASLRGLHHGQASGVLSVLHKANRIARLNERRDRCLVYVHPDHVQGRETTEQGSKRGLTPREKGIVSVVRESIDRGWTPTANQTEMLLDIISRLSGEEIR